MPPLRRGEEDVSLPPEDDRLWLMFLQQLLPLGIKINIGAVVVEQVHLNLATVRTLERDQIVGVPIIWADQFRQGGPGKIDGFNRIESQEAGDSFLVCRTSIQPQGLAQTPPDLGEANLVCIGVLDD